MSDITDRIDNIAKIGRDALNELTADNETIIELNYDKIALIHQLIEAGKVEEKLKAEKIVLTRAMQEIAYVVGLSSDSSPSEIVSAVEGLQS